MAELEIERIAQDRYRLRFRGQLMTVDSQALRDIYDWCLLHMRELEQEAEAAKGIRIPPGHPIVETLKPKTFMVDRSDTIEPS